MVGGGNVAERKTATLLEYEAEVTVVSPEISPALAGWAEQHLIAWRRGVFQPGDLEGVFLVFIATGDSETNRSVSELCRRKGIMVNAVDDPDNCDFYVPSILRRNSLCLAISTEGKSPLLAARLRRELEETITAEYGQWVDILGSLRDEIKHSDLNMQEKKQLFETLVYSDILDLLKEGQQELIEERIKQCMSSLRD